MVLLQSLGEWKECVRSYIDIFCICLMWLAAAQVVSAIWPKS
jgi:hypothetical protein